MRITLTEEQLKQLEPIKNEVDKSVDKEELGIVLAQIVLHGPYKGRVEIRFIENEMAQKLIQTLNGN